MNFAKELCSVQSQLAWVNIFWRRDNSIPSGKSIIKESSWLKRSGADVSKRIRMTSVRQKRNTGFLLKENQTWPDLETHFLFVFFYLGLILRPWSYWQRWRQVMARSLMKERKKKETLRFWGVSSRDCWAWYFRWLLLLHSYSTELLHWPDWSLRPCVAFYAPILWHALVAGNNLWRKKKEEKARIRPVRF